MQNVMLKQYEFIVLLLIDSIKILTIGSLIMGAFMGILMLERKLIGRFTGRYGPNRVGPFGLLQPVADGVKMFFKEEIVPGHVDRLVYLIAPALSLTAALLTFAVVPFGQNPITLPWVDSFTGFPVTLTPWIADINVGILYLMAIGSLGTYGVVLGGWASNNKYSLLGGLRTSAQMLSYELPVGVAMLSVVLVTGTLRVREIVEWQTQFGGFAWLIFVQPIAFIIFFIGGLAEAGRAPFDLPETENELIGGFITEYGAMKFGLFQAAEFVHAMMLCTVLTTVFLGGWNLPFLVQLFAAVPALQVIAPLVHLGVFLGKAFFLYCVLIWVRASVPRMRFDQLMGFCWKFLLPIGLANLIITALVLAVLFF